MALFWLRRPLLGPKWGTLGMFREYFAYPVHPSGRSYLPPLIVSLCAPQRESMIDLAVKRAMRHKPHRPSHPCLHTGCLVFGGLRRQSGCHDRRSVVTQPMRFPRSPHTTDSREGMTTPNSILNPRFSGAAPATRPAASEGHLR